MSRISGIPAAAARKWVLGRPSKGCASMPRISFPVSNRHIDEPILVTDIHPIRQPDADSISGRAGSLPPTIRERTPWQSMGVGVASLGIPVGIGVLEPASGLALTVIEIVVVLTIIGTALFGNLSLSEARLPPLALAREPP